MCIFQNINVVQKSNNTQYGLSANPIIQAVMGSTQGLEAEKSCTVVSHTYPGIILRPCFWQDGPQKLVSSMCVIVHSTDRQPSYRVIELPIIPTPSPIFM